MFRTMLLSLAVLAGATFVFQTPASAQSADEAVTKVNEKPQPGEKTRTTAYDKAGRKRGTMVVFATGITRVEVFRVDGTLNLVQESDYKGFSHSTEYGADGKAVQSETYTRDTEKESEYQYNPDGSFKITWYGYSNGNRQAVDEVTAKGEVSRTVYAFDGTANATIKKGKREIQKEDLVAKTTWFTVDGKVDCIEYLNVDRTLRTVHLEDDGVTPRASVTMDRPWHTSRSNRVAEARYHKGKMTTDRARRPDNGLDLRVYQADGKTLRVRQKWNFLAREKDSNRVTDLVLGTVEEFGPTGKPVLKITLDPLGRKVRVVELFVDGVLTQKRTLRDDAEMRVDGTVEKDEFFDASGKITSEKGFKVTDGERAMIDSNLLLDPVYQEDEPGKARIFR